MTAAPLLPRNAPFSPEDIDTLNGVVSRTTAQQRSWLAGFFAGYEAAQGGQQLPQAVAPPKPRQPLTVLYGSESGNQLNATTGRKYQNGWLWVHDSA